MLLYLISAYLLGSIPTGLLIGKLVKGIDIREHGSKNIGATNVFRNVGKTWGILVMALDALKGVIAVKLPVFFGLHPTLPQEVLLGIITILGHSFPIWLKFKGGKGAATSLGVFCTISFVPAFSAFILWWVVLLTSRIMSLASLTAALVYPILVFATYREVPGFEWLFIVSLLLCVFMFYTHRTNIQRILKGEEKKLF